jgi:hypothetical protein
MSKKLLIILFTIPAIVVFSMTQSALVSLFSSLNLTLLSVFITPPILKLLSYRKSDSRLSDEHYISKASSFTIKRRNEIYGSSVIGDIKATKLQH